MGKREKLLIHDNSVAGNGSMMEIEKRGTQFQNFTLVSFPVRGTWQGTNYSNSLNEVSSKF